MVNENLSTISHIAAKNRCMFHGRKRRRIRRATPVRLDIIICLLLLSVSAAFLPSGVDCFLLQHEPLSRTIVSSGTTTRLFQAFNNTATTSTPTPKPKRQRKPNTRVREIVEVLVHATKTDAATTTTPAAENANNPRLLNPTLALEHSSADAKQYRNQSNWGPEWSKTRDYLYNSRSDLSVEQVKRVVHFLEDVLAGDKELVCSVIQSHPRILRKSVKSFLKPTAEFLLDLYGTELLCESVRRFPGILLSRGVGSGAPQEAVAAIEKYLTFNLGLKESEVTKLRKKAPWLFQRSTDQIQSVVNFWDNILESSGKTLPARQIILGKLLRTYPTLFNLSVEKALTAKVAFLEEQCGLTREDVASLLSGSKASLFCLSVEDNLQPTLELLRGLMPGGTDDEESREDEEQVKREQMRKCVVKHPQILCLSRKNLKEKISYFDAIDASFGGIRKEKDSLASRVVIRSPAVYSLSLTDNIIPKISFLAKVWAQPFPDIAWDQGKLRIQALPEARMAKDNADTEKEDSSSLAALLGEYPSILTLSLEGNIQPTLNFYNRTGFIHLDSDWNKLPENRNREEIDTAVSPVSVIRPRYIASSLFQRLLPRWHFYLANKEHFSNNMEKKGVHSFSLHLLSVANDIAFCEHISVDIEDYKVFKEEAVPRLKFSSQFDTWLKTGRPIDV